MLGVIVMDLIVLAWARLREGANVGRQQFEMVKNRAAEGLDDVGARLALTAEGREESAERAKVKAEAEAQAASERKQRMDERLKDY